MKRLVQAVLVLLLSFGAQVPRGFGAFDPVGQDIDIFLANPNFVATRPNVIIMLDNTANWNQAFVNEKSALVAVVNGLSSDFNVGLMFFTEPNDHGGYVRFGVRQMTATNKAQLSALVNALDINNDKGSSNDLSQLMYEAYAYWGGLSVFKGITQAKRDYAGNAVNTQTAKGYDFANLPTNSIASSASTTYISPITDGCQKNFQIYISNGPSNEAQSLLDDSQAKLAAITGMSPPGTILLSTTSPDDNSQQKNWMDEYAQFMANGDCNASFSGKQSVITYVVEVDPGTTGQGPGMTTLMKSVATNGKGKYFSVSSAGGGAAIVAALQQIFQEIQAVNSVFAAVTLPVDVNVRGTNLNQVYIGVFRPDATRSPRWFGNLKLYDLQVDSSGNPFLADALGAKAENTSTGFTFNTAQSFWTSSSRDALGTAGTGFWKFRTPYDAADVGQDNDLPDGDIVEKGGAAQRLRKVYPDSSLLPNRNLYTCTTGCNAGNPGSALSATPFADGNAGVTAGLLGTYVRKSVTSLTSSGTTATATVAGHGFANGDLVTVTGATPTVYNVTNQAISNVATNTFDYTISSAVSGSIGSVISTAHGLASGDLVTVINSNESGYNVTLASLSKTDADGFTYALSASVTAASSGHTVTGSKVATALMGYATGSSSSLIAATVPGHSYTTATPIAISGASPSEFNTPSGTPASITVTGTDYFTYAITSAVSGDSTIARATSSSPHGFTVGDTVTINGASSGYGGSVTVVSPPASLAPSDNAPNTFYYTISTQSSDPTSQSGISAVKTGISLTPSSSNPMVHGNNSGVVTVNFSTAHGLTAGTLVTVSNASQSEYNGSWTIDTVPTSTSFTYHTAIGDPQTATPATGTITATSGGVTKTVQSMVHATSGSFTAQSTAAVTFAAAHGFTNGASVTIAGAADPVWNGTFTLSTAAGGSSPISNSATQLTYVNTGVSSAASPATANPSTLLNVATSSTVTLSSLRRVVTATASPTMYATRTLTVASLSTQTSAAGTIFAGRQSDADATDRTNLINWVRGWDNYADENSNNSTITPTPDVRASIHGDVLHARPAVVNYNRVAGNNDVVVFYGANDGILHAVQGGTGSTGGNELWGFIPSEFFGKLDRLRKTTPTITASTPRDYFFDGPISVYTHDLNGDEALNSGAGDKVQMFVGMRRGGRWIYALDVSDPANPKFMWKVGCPNLTDNTGCTTGFDKLGQTWSLPHVGFLKAYTNPVLIFGAGYDPSIEDFQPCLVTANTATSITAQTGGTVTYNASGSCTYSGTTATTKDRTAASAIGQGIFIVDATDGSLKRYIGPKTASATVTNVSGMTYSMAADLTVLNRDRDTTRTITGTENILPGYLDRIYAVDTGGNVWRLDVDDADPANWRVAKLAAISGSTLATQRKFLFPPDVVYTNDINGNFDAVLVGSGDREHPFDATISNAFYMFKDRETTNVTIGTAAPATINGNEYDASTNVDGLFDATSNCLQDATVCTASQQATARSNLFPPRGWFLSFATGEKTVGGATTQAASTFFNTNQPSASAGGGACSSNLGVAREYVVNFKDATATTNLGGATSIGTEDRSIIHSGGGYLPTPVPVIVQIGGKRYQAVISGTAVETPGSLKLESRVRTYWYRKIE